MGVFRELEVPYFGFLRMRISLNKGTPIFGSSHIIGVYCHDEDSEGP